MRVEVILTRLKGVRSSGDGWMALCPSHADRNPSLSIRERERKILLHCFAGCTVESVCGALRIRVGDLFADPPRGRMEPRIVKRAQKQIAGLRSRLSVRDRERRVTVVLANESNFDSAIARALALAVEGELVQVVLESEAQ